MIFFEGYQQLYRVEELSAQKAASLLTEQYINQEETKESAHEIMNRSYSFRTNLKKSLKTNKHEV